MKKDMLDDDFFDKEIENFLASYVVQECDPERIDETIDVLKDYMPKAKKKYSLIKMIKNELSYVNKIYALVALIFIILGRFLTLNEKISPYNVMLAASPIPVFIGLYEITKNKRNNMWEIERSTKYSYSLISLSRILIVIGISCIFNIMFSLTLCSISDKINFFQCTASWIVPMSIIFSVELFIFHFSSNRYISLCVSCVWMSLIVAFDNFIISFLENASNGILVLIMLLSIAVFMASVCKFYRLERNYEGEVLWN